jgi:hypothetical protein
MSPGTFVESTRGERRFHFMLGGGGWVRMRESLPLLALACACRWEDLDGERHAHLAAADTLIVLIHRGDGSAARVYVRRPETAGEFSDSQTFRSQSAAYWYSSSLTCSMRPSTHCCVNERLVIALLPGARRT